MMNCLTIFRGFRLCQRQVWRFTLAWLLGSLLLSCSTSRPTADLAPVADIAAEATPDPFSRGYTLAELQADFKELQSRIELTHPKLYADRTAVAALLETNYGRLAEGMTELDLLRLLAPIVSRLNCGHTALSLSAAYQERLASVGRYFPLLLRFLGGKAYISGNSLYPAIPLGAELLSINDQSMADIVAVLFASMSADGFNQTGKFAQLNGWFRYKYQNIIDDQGDYDITWRTDAAGPIQSAHLAGAGNATIAQAHQAFFDSWNASHDRPFEADFQAGYARLIMRSFYPEGNHSLPRYKSFIDDFFTRVQAEAVGTVILDVRGNSGGDPYVTAHLFSFLAETAQPYFADSAPGYYPSLKRTVPLAAKRFGGRLLVLMDGASFSSTGHLLALLRSQSVGSFIGEESGGSFVCTDGSQDYRLCHSGLQFRSSTIVWEVATAGLEPGRGIMPDHPVQPSIADWLAGRDTVLDYAVRLAGQP
ncbi:MAG: hypothetical protein A2087_12900 [Spirochaetes bacterium GWD1_61_31]|nr:MAG: hypothetical protein A2Y37_05635 [Spirochaetes bacterium GWB1_60_80]OHD34398.1 MAG: hypothetical protein A2004_06990 [Spirochaetes bacterium GWC1_61_12]OHD35613.1 MAG: hypothetical protein A2087_12900 [Spirochaetes bacterium GWD1_61_31]OHD41651.1 MAG: hypothetical protein A2Y35_08915 [Spirochaetes bacterium GWE1_60_18]OHD61688.1 MAG: hypothetical protein A2Y32_03095 [Spirochaetes bacterium GWF1_60_12]HAP42893.1 hypothetical protein [Spirochaetaceae bacterium]